MFRIDRADHHAADGRLRAEPAQALVHLAGAGVTAGQRLLDEHPAVGARRRFEAGAVAGIVRGGGNHYDVAAAEGIACPGLGLGRRAEGTDDALLAQLQKRGEAVAVLQCRQVGVRAVHEHEVQIVGAQPAQAALHAHARMPGAEVMTRHTAGERLAHFRDDHPVRAVAWQQRPDAGFADPVGRRRVDEIDAGAPGLMQKFGQLRVRGQGKPARIGQCGVAAEFRGAQAERRDCYLSLAERPQVHAAAAHGGAPTCGRGRLASASRFTSAAGRTPSPSSTATT